MELHAVKGVGKDHAKFSPVATASYRLLPHIKITKPIPPHLSEKFQKCFSPGVIKIDPRTKEVSVDEENVRNDTVSREVLRHPEFAGSVELSRVRDISCSTSSQKAPTRRKECSLKLSKLCEKNWLSSAKLRKRYKTSHLEGMQTSSWLIHDSIRCFVAHHGVFTYLCY
ncbi:hypothetical protein CPB84DRAFT_691836 [Gymnopilus junonius]|uniref:DNA-directed RNA polymerase RpoA/D/Rpb3-type domain-containing protein n=1 Tax=Gymnopilus junonius TaxID=109634 RepID=A0A9P5TFU9_GYMJU|nr:hypothetical protein CPB84DRAFT_691836 [Gymnopilus junonius]